MVNAGMGRHIRFPYPPRLTGSDLTRMQTSLMPSTCRACYYIHVKIHFLLIFTVYHSTNPHPIVDSDGYGNTIRYRKIRQ